MKCLGLRHNQTHAEAHERVAGSLTLLALFLARARWHLWQDRLDLGRQRRDALLETLKQLRQRDQKLSLRDVLAWGDLEQRGLSRWLLHLVHGSTLDSAFLRFAVTMRSSSAAHFRKAARFSRS